MKGKKERLDEVIEDKSSISPKGASGLASQVCSSCSEEEKVDTMWKW